MTDAIVTAVKGTKYSWEDFIPFVNSLRLSGFGGEKAVLANDISKDVSDKLYQNGFEVILYTTNITYGSYCTERTPPFLKYLEERGDNLRYVVWTDWRDVVIQTDPVVWLEKNPYQNRLIGCSECVSIEHEYYNREWVKTVAGNDGYEKVREQEICCAGTIIGEAPSLKLLISKMCEYISRDPGYIDQGILNYVLRLEPFKSITRIPRLEEAFVASCNWYLIPSKYTGVGGHLTNPSPELRDGMVYPAGSQVPFSIVHQYDRDKAWKESIERRYK